MTPLKAQQLIATATVLFLASCAPHPCPVPLPPHCQASQFAAMTDAELARKTAGYSLVYAPNGLVVELPYEVAGGQRAWGELLALRLCEAGAVR